MKIPYNFKQINYLYNKIINIKGISDIKKDKFCLNLHIYKIKI
jgi:hypothetical protein